VTRHPELGLFAVKLTKNAYCAYCGEWVDASLKEPCVGPVLTSGGGTVRWHGKDREEIYRRAVEIRPNRFAIVYTGKMPPDTAIVLCALPSMRGRA
jgi:hypothetical protein